MMMTSEQGHENSYCKPRTPYQMSVELPHGGGYRDEGGVGEDRRPATKGDFLVYMLLPCGCAEGWTKNSKLVSSLGSARLGESTF